MKKTSLLGACILALAMSMGSGEAVAKTPPDQLIIGMNMNNLLTLDPAAMTGNEVVGIVVNLYDSLVELTLSSSPPSGPRWRNPGISAPTAKP